MPPPIQSLHHFTIVCRDLDESVRFYQDVLGGVVEPRVRRPSVGAPGGHGPVQVAIGNVVIDMFQADDTWQPYPGSYAQHYAFLISWDDVDEWFDHMRKHNVPISIHPTGDRALSLYFSDPSGYHLELNLRGDPELVREQTGLLIERYGNAYHWVDGNGVPEGQPQAPWAMPAASTASA